MYLVLAGNWIFNHDLSMAIWLLSARHLLGRLCCGQLLSYHLLDHDTIVLVFLLDRLCSMYWLCNNLLLLDRLCSVYWLNNNLLMLDRLCSVYCLDNNLLL